MQTHCFLQRELVLLGGSQVGLRGVLRKGMKGVSAGITVVNSLNSQIGVDALLGGRGAPSGRPSPPSSRPLDWNGVVAALLGPPIDSSPLETNDVDVEG